MRRLAALVALAALLLLPACGGGGDDDTEAGSASTTPPATSTATPVATADTPDTPAPTETPGSPTELFQIPGMAEVVILTPSTDAGERPLLEWQPVEGATDYSLALTADDGGAYWAWRGASSSVWLGGSAEEPPADASGPLLTQPMTLRVVAHGANGQIIAASAPTEIAP